LAIALALSGAAQALGLGELRIESALNQPLSAQIDIIGATHEDLATLTARVANPEVFQRYNAERPAYLETITFKVDESSQGRAVLRIHSTDVVADPLVTLLIDLHWVNGEVIRDYSLLLDPATIQESAPNSTAAMAPAAQDAPIAPIAPTASTTSTSPPVSTSSPIDGSGSEYRVLSGDTLTKIAIRHGAHSRPEVQRTMIAIFRANPQAFDGNLNILHLGAQLTLPSMRDLAATDAVQAQLEVAEQLQAWKVARVLAAVHANTPAALTAPAALASTPAPTPAAAAAAAPAHAPAPAPTVTPEALHARIQSLSSALDDVHLQLATTNLKIQQMRQLAARVAPPATVSVARTARVRPASHSAQIGFLVIGVGLTVAGLTWQRRRRPRAAAPAIPAQDPAATITTELTMLTLPNSEAGAPPSIELRALADRAEQTEPTDRADWAGQAGRADPATATVETVAPQDTIPVQVLDESEGETVVIESTVMDSNSKLARNTVLDYNLLDLDSSAVHVHMPSDLKDRPVEMERRISVVDALRSAILRDPTRRDLRMKLLETYFELAATHQRAFVQYARMQACEDDLSAEDWQNIMAMGREIAPGETLFVDDNAAVLSNCA